MKNLIKRFRTDGKYYTLRWVILGMMLFIIIGTSFGAVYTVIFEQTASGKYAIHSECQDSYYGVTGGDPSQCYTGTLPIVTSLGAEVENKMKSFALIFGILGFLSGWYAGEKLKIYK